MEREPAITDWEEVQFRLCIAYTCRSFEKFGQLNGYRGQYIRQVLANKMNSNYVRLLIRNYIKDVKPMIVTFLTK